jgi:hypothetical protein
MKRATWAAISVLSMLAYLGIAATSRAVYIDKKGTFQFTARLQTRASVRLNDSEGFTFPRDIYVANLVQWRNLAMIEIDHDLVNLTKDLDVLYPLKVLRIQSKYRLVGRFIYEAVYDVGPQSFQDVKERDKGNIDKFSHTYDLWEFYFDFSRGPWFLRIGRQNLAWGETDMFRLLDYINPLDNTFGGPFEDLDDRRIPLWMLRGTYDLGGIGPISSLMVEGFWVPGNWDVRVAPFPPVGTPYFPPLPAEYEPFLRVVTPDKTMSNSRWGLRVQGLVGTALNLSVCHYKTYLDGPALRSVVTRNVPVLLDLDALILEASFPPVQITGGSVSYWESHLDVILRGEVAWFWDEPVFIPEENLGTFFGPVIPLPPPLLDLAAEILGVDVRDLGLNGIPVNPQSGTIPKKNILRFMVGVDKQVWIRPLNKRSMFLVSMQYFGQWIPDYDERLRQGIALYPNFTNFAKQKELESVLTALIGTNYMNGRINPQVGLGYDVRGAWLLLGAVNYVREPFRFSMQYAGIEGNMTGFGAYRDRDQISFILTYLLN